MLPRPPTLAKVGFRGPLQQWGVFDCKDALDQIAGTVLPRDDTKIDNEFNLSTSIKDNQSTIKRDGTMNTIISGQTLGGVSKRSLLWWSRQVRTPKEEAAKARRMTTTRATRTSKPNQNQNLSEVIESIAICG